MQRPFIILFVNAGLLQLNEIHLPEKFAKL